MIHSLFFGLAGVAINLAIMFAPLVLGYRALRWLNDAIWRDGRYQFSLRPFLLLLLALALLFAIYPESRKEWSRMDQLEQNNPDPEPPDNGYDLE